MIIALSGVNAVHQVKDQNDMGSAVMSMEQMRSEMSSMAYENGSSKQFEFAAHNTKRVGVSQDGYIAFSINGRASCTANRSMGMVRFKQDDGDVVAYEANGVWKKTEERGSVMVSPPDIEYKNETLDGGRYRTLNYPLVNVNATRSKLGRSSTLTVKNTGNMRAQVERDMCLREPRNDVIDEVDNVTITVSGTTFHDAWADYFEETFPNQSVHHYPANETVVVPDIPLGLLPESCSGRPPSVSFFADNGSARGHHVSVDKGESVTLFASATDSCSPDRSIPRESIDLPHGPTVNATTVTYSWTTPGPKTVTFRAVDQDGDVATKTVTVDVSPSHNVGGGGGGGGSCSPSDPTATLVADNGSHTGDRVTVSTDDPVTFTGTASDGDSCGPGDQIRDEQILAHEFTGHGSTATHSWSQPGLYTVTYLVRDNEGNVASDQAVVEVTANDGGDDNGGGGGGGPPDQDGDGVADSVDECPTVAGQGENGCTALSEEHNALRVNQSSGTLTVLGTHVTRTNVTKGSERKPLDVMFVLDETGSMEIGGRVDRQCIRYDSYYCLSTGEHQVPSGQHWERIRDGERTFFHPGDTVTIRRSDYLNVWSQIGNDPNEERVDATKEFIGALNGSNGDRAGVVHFDTEANVASGLSSNLDAVNDSISPDPGGGTRIGVGLQAAVDEHEHTAGPEQDVIVLLTDGENSYGDDETYAAAQAAADDGITVYTVGLGDGVDTELLKQVASVTGGKYYAVDDADGLEAAFAEIAGEAIDPVRRVEYNTVESRIDVTNSDDPRTIDLGALNDPDGTGTVAKDLDEGEPGWLLSLDTTVTACRNPVETAESYEDAGKVYNETRCDSGTPQDSVDRSDDARHNVYFDDDPVPTYDPDRPWQTNVTTIVESYDPTLVDEGTFDLGPNQAVIVTRFSPGNVTVSLFAADDTPPPEPTCTDSLPNASLSIAPGRTVSNGTTVTVTGSASDDDACGVGPQIQNPTLVGDGPGGTAFDVSGNETDHAWTTPGQYQVTYSGQDNEGNAFSVTDVVTVLGPAGGSGGNCVDGDPAASVSASSPVAVGETVTITGSASDGDACGPGIVSESLTGPGVHATDSATVSWSSTGTKTITYTVKDDEGNTETATITIHVVDGGTASGSDGPDDGFVIGIGGSEVVVG